MSGKSSPSVIVPVYNAADELAQCLESLHANLAAGTVVIIIDDASPDAAVQALLSTWKQRAVDGWSFERNTSNLGFVGTANRGMRLAQGDVVLLNSDTVTTPGWLQGLQRCLGSNGSIGTATPWTNNGEIVSIPAFCAPNPIPEDPVAVARVIADSGEAVYPSVPTAVGFCMAISRRAINRVGLFNESLFGKGYGEENDFSMRISQAEMRNVLCDDVYVVHVGGCSFGPLGLKPDESSMQRLLSRHPAYLEIVQEFIRKDPLSVRRQEIVAALEREGIRLG